VVGAVAALPAERAAALTSKTPTRTAAPAAPAPPALKRSTFTPLLHNSFQMIDAKGTAITVVLSKISDLSPVIVANDPNRFSLMFDGAMSQPRPQGIYHFKNARIGTVDLFVVPVDLVVSTRHYQAIINGLT
jgi:hypothetical protein